MQDAQQCTSVAVAALIKDESHRSYQRTRYWCDQYKLALKRSAKVIDRLLLEIERQREDSK